jgi:hypothetical protein
MSSTNPIPHDNHSPPGLPSPEVIARGYEPDEYDARSVLSVPLLVILFFVLAFGTVTIIFAFIAYPKGDPRAHPTAVVRNKAPLNERLDRIHRGSKDVDQPRLEPLRERQGNERAITSPEAAEGNSPELHPEDLIVTKERFPALYATGGGKYGLDRTMALSDQALGKLFRVQEPGSRPIRSPHVPTAANAGRGAEDAEVIPPATPKIPVPGAAPAPPPNNGKDKGKDKDKEKGDKK